MTNATSSIQDNITLDSYVVKLTGSTVFTKDKNGGGNRGRASANIQFESLEPNIAHSLPEGTSIDATVRTTAATSVSGNETSFSDKGYSPVSLVGETTFPDPRMVASKVNEDAQMTALPGSKSFTFDMVFSTDDENVSPVVDVFKSSVLTESSRVNSPVENYSTDSRVNTLDDPHNNLYLTKVIKLENPATSLKVLFAAFRPASADIRVLYRLQRSDSDEIDKVFELFPGFQNLDTNGNVIAPANNNGQADSKIAASLEDQFLEYEYSVDDLPQFTGFQIKVVLSSVNQAEDPELLDFRSIAVA